jgi:hypothetical protein
MNKPKKKALDKHRKKAKLKKAKLKAMLAQKKEK